MTKILPKDNVKSVADIKMFKARANSITLINPLYAFERYITNSREKSPMKEVHKLNINKITINTIKPSAEFLISGKLRVILLPITKAK